MTVTVSSWFQNVYWKSLKTGQKLLFVLFVFMSNTVLLIFFFTVIIHWQDKPMFRVLKTKRQSLCFSVYGEWALCTTQGSKCSAYALHMHTDRYLSFKMFTAFRKSVGNKLVSFSSIQHLHSFVVKAIFQGVMPYSNDIPWNKLWERLF